MEKKRGKTTDGDFTSKEISDSSFGLKKDGVDQDVLKQKLLTFTYVNELIFQRKGFISWRNYQIFFFNKPNYTLKSIIKP